MLDSPRLWQVLKSFHRVVRSSGKHDVLVEYDRVAVASHFAVLLPEETVHLFMPHSLLLNVADDTDT